MEWINIYGVVFIAIIMIPNIVFSIKNKDGYKGLWRNKAALVLEQIGRYGCFVFMIVVIPRCGFGFSTNCAFALYLIVDAILIIAYCLIWTICFRKNSVFRALALSAIPSAVFLFSGAITRYLPLLIAAVIFSPCHILISYKNAVLERES